jgi:cell division septal protein FtsQ
MRTPRKPKTIRATRSMVTDGDVVLLDRQDRPADSAGTRGTLLEFPAPRASHRIRNSILWIVALALVLGGVTAYAVFSPALALRTVDVRGNTLVTAEEVESALRPLTGVPLTRISPDQVRGLLADSAPIADVDIAAEPPSTLVVTVTERQPVAVLQSGGEYILIDAEGRHLAEVARREDVRLPLIAGGTAAVNTAVFSSITAVLAELPGSVLSRLNSASATSVDSIQLSLAGDQRIFWGSSERNAEKARVLEVMLGMPEQDPPVREFDISTPDRPVTR